MSIVYIAVILIPTILSSIYFFVKASENIIDIYNANSQQLLEQSYANFKAEISVLESTYQLFQYNTSIIDFLSGYYTTESEEVYTFLKDIRSLFAYAHASNDHIEDIRIYKFRKSLVNYQYFILDEDRFEGKTDIIKGLGPNHGKWIFDTKDDEKYMKYYRKTYSKNFDQELGFIQISIKSEELLNMFNTINGNQIFLLRQGNTWYEIQDGVLNKIDNDSVHNPLIQLFFESGMSEMKRENRLGRKLLVHYINMSDLDAEIYLLTSIENMMGKGTDYAPLLCLAILLFILIFFWQEMMRFKAILSKGDAESQKNHNDMVNKVISL